MNNAGIVVEPTDPKPVWETPTDRWEKTMAVNATGVFNGIRAASRQMVKQEPWPSGDRGWIVNLASIFGVVGFEATCMLFTLVMTLFCTNAACDLPTD